MGVLVYDGVMTPQIEGYMTTEEAAEALGVGAQWVRDLCNEGRLEAEKVGGIWLIKIKSVENFQRKTPGPKPTGSG